MVKFPKTIGESADALKKLRDQRKELDAQSNALKEQEDALEQHIIGLLKVNKLTSGRGILAQATISPLIVPKVIDWDKLHAYIAKTKNWSLLQRRIGVTAWRELLDDKKLVPGTEAEKIEQLSLTAVKR